MLYVKDFPHMKKFYEQMLGTPPVNTEWTDTWALFDVGGARFALHAIPPEHARNIQIAFLPKARGTDPVKLIFGVDSVPAERSRLEAMGITVLQRPWQEPNEACEAASTRKAIFFISQPFANSLASTEVIKASRDRLNPLAPPGRRRKGIREILRLAHDLTVAEFH